MFPERGRVFVVRSLAAAKSGSPVFCERNQFAGGLMIPESVVPTQQAAGPRLLPARSSHVRVVPALMELNN